MDESFRVFVVAPIGRDGQLICDMLAERGISCQSCSSISELSQNMEEGVGVIVATEEALGDSALRDLYTLLSTQPKWSDIGIILLTSNNERGRLLIKRAMEEAGTARSIYVVERPVRRLSLLSTIESALKSRQRQYEVRDYVAERLRSEEQLRQTQKLESVGLLAGGIAHDFNNLLTGVLGNASLALDLLPPGSPVQKLLENVVQASERAAHLTRQLLAYAGRGRFLVEAFDLSAHVREISTLIQTSIPKNVQLRLDLASGLPQIEADAAQLQQVVMNLVINGAEAIPEGRSGVVSVTTSLQEVDETYLRTTLPDTGIKEGIYVTLEVHDSGIGMTPETMSHIFDPFFTTKFTGRGLGLAAVLGIVRGHKGGLKIYSSPGQGTTFKVLFPAVTVPAQKEGVESDPAAISSGAGTVLVIDDEEIVRRTACVALTKFGYRVLEAADGQSGIDLFRRHRGEVTLVLLDMTMPGKSGEETFRELRMLQSDVVVILSSGYNEAETIRRFTGKGLAGFLQKPYSAARLAQVIRIALGADTVARPAK